MNNTGIKPSSANGKAESFASNAIPVRKGARPKTIMGPLHIQCNGHGDPKYLKQLVDAVLVYTPKNREELAVCYSLFAKAYHFACKIGKGQ